MRSLKLQIFNEMFRRNLWSRASVFQNPGISLQAFRSILSSTPSYVFALDLFSARQKHPIVRLPGNQTETLATQAILLREFSLSRLR